ncbi:carbohydrate ABC transporter permease [Neobacillus cucumis]|uniref:Arabinose transporter permease n=1 Tax=Neobacillus cucumis TaxID=1740721 RepID=A0A2N5HVP1_9BACI|nr:carbohydrate ABC transporter permease [Neobacillus cucumis]PLS09579.1 arabinose transporter permease [Neobacillus cucumis]
MQTKNKGISILLFIFFLVISLLVLFPFFAILLASFKPSTELMRFGLNLKLQRDLLSLHNYTQIFTQGKEYLLWYKNSIFITFLYTTLSLFFSSIVGYALGVYKFKGNNTIFVLVLIVLMIPIEIMMMPLYKEMIAFKLMNTYMGVVFPFIATPYAIFFFRQYAMGLPKDLLDAARMDGCNEYGIYFRIMAPIMKPAFGAMAILQAMHGWNNFLWPLIVLRTNDMFTLPIGLAGLISPYGTNYDLLISGSVLTIIPILVLFLFFQRYFISGLTLGGVKG